MSGEDPTSLPAYQAFVDAIAALELPISASKLHGIMCGYLCAGASRDGEAYLSAYSIDKSQAMRNAVRALFGVYTISQQQMLHLDFKFQLMLPAQDCSLVERAKAFSDWCEGFTKGMTLAGVNYQHLHDDEVRDALHHLAEFAKLNYEALKIDEEDEKALMEVSEYARMAVLRLYGELVANEKHDSQTKIKH